MEPIVGIDLGTTNSEIAYIIDGQAEVIAHDDAGILPSCVGIDNDGKIIVGHGAKNQASIYPDRTVVSIKRLMGSDKRVNLGNNSYSPQEISAFILKALKERAEQKIGQSISNAVITVPAYFTDAQRKATREAGEIAGLNVARIINEPTAAALAYESHEKDPKKIIIYDLGGGTFDVSIVKIEDGVVEVLSSTGDNHLGGDDFDAKIVDHLADHLEKKHQLQVDDNIALQARLKRVAEDAKIKLSSQPYVQIEEDHIAKKKLKSVHLSLELSRMDFEAMIEDDLLKTMDSVNTALKDAELLPKDIDKIILVGGSTRIPILSRMLEKKFNKLPHGEIDPDLCVAIGAGIQAGRLMGIDSDSLLLDITPYSFGTSALGEIDGIPTHTKYVPLIKKNTKLPVSKSDVFYTIFENQEAVNVEVYQGENEDAVDNINLGTYHFELSKAPANNPIVLNYDLDINGILKIEAVEKHSGRKINGVIENAFSQINAEDLSRSKEKIDDIWVPNEIQSSSDIEMTKAEPDFTNDIPENIRSIIDQAKTSLEDASSEDRDEMINLIEDIIEAANNGQIDEAQKYSKELEDILFYIA